MTKPPTPTDTGTGTGRIRWEPTKYGGWTGHVGARPETGWLFQIWNAAPVGGDWQLDSNLPGHFGQHFRDDDPATLKADAEVQLAEFVSSLGAIFPDAPATDSDCEECGFGLPRHDKDCSHYLETAGTETGQ